MSAMQPYRPSPLPDRLPRREAARLERERGRELAYLDHRTRLGVARLDAQAELDAAACDALAAVGTRALHDAAMVSQVELSLARQTPHAVDRLQLIANSAAMGMADVVARTARRLGR